MRRWILIALAIAAMVLLLVLPLFPLRVETAASRAFQIDVPMPRSRAVLVRTNSVQEIVAMSDAEVVEQRFSGGGMKLRRLIRDPDVTIELDGTLVVRPRDRWMEGALLTFDQDISIELEDLQVISSLTEPAAVLQSYDARMRLVPGVDGQSAFEAEVEMTVQLRVGLLFRGYARKQIKEAAERAVSGQEQALRQVIEAHRDDAIVLPDFGGLFGA